MGLFKSTLPLLSLRLRHRVLIDVEMFGFCFGQAFVTFGTLDFDCVCCVSEFCYVCAKRGLAVYISVYTFYFLLGVL
jgi:hypothetical protein